MTGALVYADRKKRNLSRAKYAALVGLSANKIMNLEQGREFKEDEAELLRPFIFGPGGAGLDDRDFTDPVEVHVGAGLEGLQPIEVIGRDIIALNRSMPEIELLYDDELDDDLSDQIRIYTGTYTADVEDEIEELPPVMAGDENSVGGGWFEKSHLDPNDILSIHEAEPEVQIIEAPVAVPVTIEKYEFKLEGYHLSNSELKTFKRCHRKWWLAYYRELRLKRTDHTGPRAIGTRLHLALSAYYAEPPQNAWDVFNADVEADRAKFDELDAEKLEKFEKEVELCRIMLEGYFEWLEETGADDGIEIIGNEEVVEVEFATVLGVLVILIGKLDLRIKRNVDGLRMFLDHKSVPNFESPVKTLHLDEQMLQYMLLEYLQFLSEGNTEFASGGIYNMLKKVKRSAKATPPFYARVEVRHNIKELQSFYLRVLGEATAILELKQKLDAGENPQQVAYPNPTRDCSWDCDFIMVCPMFDDGSAAEEMLAEYFEGHDPHDHYYVASDNDEKTE
jgi:transcriptional regulator with XRE-family HTH domain/RecB family exonuclease